jgi:hypothetical protein
VPPGIVFTEVDETSGGLITPYCPRNVIVQSAFKAGTEPTHLCPTHAMPTPVVPMFDEFGNPIVTTTDVTSTGLTATDTGGIDVPPDTTLTGGIFRDPTATAPPPPPPPVTTTEPEPEPPPTTDTSTTTGGPP